MELRLKLMYNLHWIIAYFIKAQNCVVKRPTWVTATLQCPNLPHGEASAAVTQKLLLECLRILRTLDWRQRVAEVKGHIERGRTGQRSGKNHEEPLTSPNFPLGTRPALEHLCLYIPVSLLRREKGERREGEKGMKNVCRKARKKIARKREGFKRSFLRSEAETVKYTHRKKLLHS